MNYRKLRIAWSVGRGLLCLMLIGLWVRRYRRVDTADYNQLRLSSFYGHVACRWVSPGIFPGFRYYWGKLDPSMPGYDRLIRGFKFQQQTAGFAAMLPNWFILLLLSMFAVGPWVPCVPWNSRYSLRALLIGRMTSGRVRASSKNRKRRTQERKLRFSSSFFAQP